MTRGKKKKVMGGAPGSRPVRAAELIREEISRMLVRQAFKDPRLEGPMVTVTEVRLSPDLYYANVYVSVLDDSEATKAGVLEGLAQAAGRIRRVLGSELRFRQAPELRFFLDESIAYGAKIEGILREISDEASGGDE